MPRAAISSSSRPRRDCSTAVRSSAAAAIDVSRRVSTTATPRPTASATWPSRCSRSRRATARARASRSAWAARTRESARPASARARSSAVRSASRASISACRAARACSASRSRSAVSGSSSGASSAAASRGLEVGEPGQVAVAGLLGGGDGGGDPLRLGLGGPGHRPELPQLLGDGGEGRVGLVQLRERDVDAALRLGALLLQPGQVEAETLAGVRRLGQLRRRPRRRRPAPR